MRLNRSKRNYKSQHKLSQMYGASKPRQRRKTLYRLIMLAALMLGVIGGLTVMLGSSPFGRTGRPQCQRSFDPATVAPGGSVTVTITAADYGSAGGVTETLPVGSHMWTCRQLVSYDSQVNRLRGINGPGYPRQV